MTCCWGEDKCFSVISDDYLGASRILSGKNPDSGRFRKRLGAATNQLWGPSVLQRAWPGMPCHKNLVELSKLFSERLELSVWFSDSQVTPTGVPRSPN